MRSSNRRLLAALAFFCAGAAEAKILQDVVARVNGQPLMLTEYRKNLRGMLENVRANLPEILKDEAKVREIREKILEQMIDDEVMAQEAEKLKLSIHARELEKGIAEVMEKGFSINPKNGRRLTEGEQKEELKKALKEEGISEAKFRDRIRRQMKIRKLIEMKVNAKLKEPSNDAAKKAFGIFKTIAKGSTDVVKGMPNDRAQAYLLFGTRVKNAHEERVRVSHILIKVPPDASMVVKSEALKKAKGLKKKLDKGGDFFETARTESDDQESAVRGGDLGPILKGWMPPAFEKAAFSLSVGEVSDPISTDFGYHLIRVQEKRASESLNFEKLKNDIKQFLMSIEHQDALMGLVKTLRKRATVEKMLPSP